MHQPQNRKTLIFDDSQIASTPIECGEGFQISGCWGVTGNPEVIPRERLPTIWELPEKHQTLRRFTSN